MQNIPTLTRRLRTVLSALILLASLVWGCESGSAPFRYHVLVKDKTTDEPIPDAEVAIVTQGLAELVAHTDDEGVAIIEVDALRAGQLGWLRVEKNGYRPYERNINLSQNELPAIIQLEKIGAVPLLPTDTPTPTSTGTPTPSATLTLTPKPSPTDTPTPSTVPTPTFGVGSEAVALRNAYVFPTVNSKTTPLALVYADESVTVQAHYGNWLQVRTDGNVTGWVYQPGWFEIAGDISVLPTVIPPPTPIPPISPLLAPDCVKGVLILDLYSDKESCVSGHGWSADLHFVARGGDCQRYTYYWEGNKIGDSTSKRELIYTVYWGNAALVGTGAVESGGVTVRKELFVPKPEGCP